MIHNSSLSHQGFSSQEGESSVELQTSQQFSAGTADYQAYNLNNMHDFEKFINPHDIAGQEGIVKTQKDELESKKVDSFFHSRVNKYLIPSGPIPLQQRIIFEKTPRNQ